MLSGYGLTATPDQPTYQSSIWLQLDTTKLSDALRVPAIQILIGCL